MANAVPQSFEELNKSTLGDKKLSREEISYMQAKDALWYKDISNWLLLDVQEVNKLSLSKNPTVKKILDYLISHPDVLLSKFNSFVTPQLKTAFKKILSDSDDFQKQSLVLNVLLFLSSASTTTDEKSGLIRPDLINLFSTTTVKSLHRYQKKYENTSWWSKADCIVWPKTIQQLIADCGMTLHDGVTWTSAVTIDSQFSKSKSTLKEWYWWAKDSQIAIDAIMADPALDAVQKTQEMIKVCKKTTTDQKDEKNGESKDKRYAAVVQMILKVKTMLAAADDEGKVQILQCFDKTFQKEISQYRNSKNSREDLGVSKSDDFWKELKEVKVESESWKNKINLALSTANLWKSYIHTCAPNAAEEFWSQIDKAIQWLQKLTRYDWADHTKEITVLLSKVFITSEEYRVKHNSIFKDKTNHTVQQYLLNTITSLFGKKTWDVIKDENWKTITVDWSKGIVNMLNIITTSIRTIDKNFDWWIFDHYQTWEWLTQMLESNDIIKPKDIRMTAWKNFDQYNSDMDAMKALFTTIPNTKLNTLISSLDKTTSSTQTVYIEHWMKTTETSYSFDKVALDKALVEVGINWLSADCKKDMWEKYKKMKEEVIPQAKKEAEQSIDGIISSFQSSVDFHTRQNNAAVIPIIQSQIDARKLFRVWKWEMPIDNTNPLLQENLKMLWLPAWSITMQTFTDNFINTKLQLSSAAVLEHYMTVWIMDKHSWLIDAIESKQNKNSSEKVLSLYANIHGVWSGWSDETYNTAMTVAKEVTIMVVATIATMWIGAAFNAAWRAVVAGGELILASEWVDVVLVSSRAAAQVLSKTPWLATRFGTWASKWTSMAKFCAKTSQWINALKGANIIGKWTIWLTKMAIEWSAFHFSSTAMSNVLHGQERNLWLQDWKWYAKTSLFLGAFKYIHGWVNKMIGLNTESWITKAFTTPASIAGKTINISKAFVKSVVGVWTEAVSMTAVDIPLSLVFDGKMPDMSAKDLAQTLWFIFWMRLYGGAVKILSIKKDASGTVTQVEYEQNWQKLFADQAKVKEAIQRKKANQKDKQINTPEQKNKNMVERMKIKAPNKIWTRKKENAPGKKPIEVVNTWVDLFAIKSDLKQAMDYIGLKNSSVVTIEWKKHIFLWVKEWKAQFVEKWAIPKEFSTIESMKDINREPWAKNTNAWRKGKFSELMNAKEIAETKLNPESKNTTPWTKAKIDNQFNNYKNPPAQKRIDNLYKQYEKQDKFELQVLQAQDLLRSQWDAKYISDAMKTLRDAGDIVQLSSNDVKRVQKEIGFKPSEADGIRWPKSQAKLESYINKKWNIVETITTTSNKFDLSRSGPKPKRNIDKSIETSEIPWLWKYEVNRRNDWIRMTLKTNFGEMTLESRNVNTKEYIMHADIPNNKLIAGKAYKFLFDKLPEWSKIVEKDSLSGDSFNNMVKLYKKWNTSNYNIYSEWYVKLNEQGKNTDIAKSTQNNKDKDVNARTAIFWSKESAEKVIIDIQNMIQGSNLPPPRIVEQTPWQFIIELPNIIIEKMMPNKNVEIVPDKSLEKNIAETSQPENKIEYVKVKNQLTNSNNLEFVNISSKLENIVTYTDYNKQLHEIWEKKIAFSDIVLTGSQLEARVTEVVQWKLSIDYIPKELRSRVTELKKNEIENNRIKKLDKNEKVILQKIRNKESVAWLLKEHRWTHRTTMESLQAILQKWFIQWWDRGVQFWPGIWSGYGDIALIMKPEVQKLPGVNNDPNIWYFFGNKNATSNGVKEVPIDTYLSSVVDFSHQRISKWDNPNINVPYLSIWKDNAWVWAKNTVSADLIEAVTLPEHLKLSPEYNTIVTQLKQKWIKIIEVNTWKNSLEYAGTSIVNAREFITWWQLSIFGKQIMVELKQKYPNLTFEEACCKYLSETRNLRWTFQQIQSKYNNEIATNVWLSRWSFASWQFQNYVSQKNFTKEQQQYFEYVLAKQVAKKMNLQPTK